MTPKTIAKEIHEDLGEPSDLSEAAIEAWLSTNTGRLGLLLYTEISIEKDLSNNEQFIPPITSKQKDIYKEMYLVRFYERRVGSSLGAGGVEWTIVKEGDSMIRRASKTELAKVYRSLQNSSQARLDNLIQSYRIDITRPLGINMQ